MEVLEVMVDMGVSVGAQIMSMSCSGFQQHLKHNLLLLELQPQKFSTDKSKILEA
jgi:hypothetical protein